MSSILFGDTVVPNIEEDYILPLGYSILYKEYNLTGLNHQKNVTQMSSTPRSPAPNTLLISITVLVTLIALS